MFNWAKKYAGSRTNSGTNWEIRRGKEALALIKGGGKSREELMKTLGLSENSVTRALKTVRSKIWLVQFGKNRVYEKRPQGEYNE